MLVYDEARALRERRNWYQFSFCILEAQEQTSACFVVSSEEEGWPGQKVAPQDEQCFLWIVFVGSDLNVFRRKLKKKN